MTILPTSCKKCGKPLNLFDGEVCGECEKMSDLIDRAEALKCLEITGDYATLNEIYERLSKLPSASQSLVG